MCQASADSDFLPRVDWGLVGVCVGLLSLPSQFAGLSAECGVGVVSQQRDVPAIQSLLLLLPALPHTTLPSPSLPPLLQRATVPLLDACDDPGHLLSVP